MASFNDIQMEEAENIIENMTYKVLDEYDSWYPTKKELESRLTGKTKTDALFLMWLTDPARPLTQEEREIKGYAMKMLYRPEIVTMR